ncbi:MAG: 16S rRNA (cytosine(1402)-N(4))-methyltransferase RsmH [Akkermansia sp.]|nr:16S rRNA (cytosine(1402)-N(4))-methyltransferase RsmH [Akkermansia sp.]
MSAAEGTAWQQECSDHAETEVDTPEYTSGEFHHVTVLLNEAVQALQPAEGKVMVDATLGGGGHTERLLLAGAEVWGIDQDPAARAAAGARLAQYGERLHIVAGNFRNAAEILRKRGVQGVDGLLADIGISSPQVDCAERGFSFLHEGPLDMRMNPAAPRSAADIVNTAAESKLADILWQYGEERASRAIARRIVQERAKAPITTTTQLADLIATVLPRKGKQHPATRSFQALRIAVNDELGALEELLHSGLSLLKSGGRFAVITFHSLEDRAVKRYFELVCKPEIDRPEWPAPRPNPAYAARLVYRKPVTPAEEELSANPRSRSAKLRVIEKL